MKKQRLRPAAWALAVALAAYVSWPAWGTAATRAYDARAFAPLLRLARRLGVEITLPAEPRAAAAELRRLVELAAARAGRLGLTLPSYLPAPPAAEAPAVEAAATEGTAAGEGAPEETPPVPPFGARDAWLDAGTFGVRDGLAKDFPVHFENRLLFEGLDIGPWLGDWRDVAAAARGYYASGYEAPVDRDVQKEAWRAWREQEEFYAWEQEQGLIPDIELGHESDIKFEGRKLFTAGYSKTSYAGGTGPEGYGQPAGDITMEGELQLRIEGTVMRKTHVYVDYDDTRENESRNQISVVYKGDPDELVQEAAFGDIILSLPATEFVSYSSSRAVFGAKVDLKYKWAELMAIASREKGRTERTTFTGGTELTSLEVKDTSYAARKFFLLNTYSNAGTGQGFFASHDVYKDANGQPKVELFVYTPGASWVPGTTEYFLDAYQFDDSKGEGETKKGKKYIEKGFRCKKLSRGTDYAVDVDEGIIRFNTTIGVEDALAVAYILADENNSPVTRIGYNANNELDYNPSGNGYEFDTPLKCIKEANEEGGALQRYEQRNYYYLGSTSIRPTSLVVKILDNNQNERYDDNTTYLRYYGLDQDNDGRVDGDFIDSSNGYITVPDVDFDDNFQRRDRNGDGYFENLPFDYDENGVVEGMDAYPKDILESKRTLYIEYESLKPSYFLQPNIIPGSETVTLNGVPLVPNRDYWLDYDSGFLELMVEGADDPTSVLEVTYEYKPLFALLTKSLVGGRFQLGPDDDRYVGSTLIAEFTSKPPGGEVPKLDEAPANHYVFDVDGRYRFYPEFMTTLADAVPGAHTSEGSTFDFQVEFARSFKDINTVGEAYVDDMEGARNLSSVPMRKEAWRPSSPPVVAGINQANRGDTLLRLDTESGHFFDEVDDSWPRDMLELLRVTNLPNDPASGLTNNPNGTSAFTWGGIQRVLSTTGLDFTQSRFDYIEIMMNLNNLTPSLSDDDVKDGILHLDLGTISEDADGDGTLDSEDTQGTPNGRLDQGEDNGIRFNNDQASPPGRIDVTINNEKILDTEDNNRNFVLDADDDYFSYDIDLGEVLSGTSPYVVRGPQDKDPLNAGWYILRVPLEFEVADAEGNPDPTKIQVLRMWVEAKTASDFPRPVENGQTILSSLYFGGITFAAMRWEEPVLEPDKGRNEMKISTKDSRHDADYVPLNPRVDLETQAEEREQALVLQYILTDWDDVGVTGPEVPGPERVRVDNWGAGNNVYDTEDVNHNGLLDEGEDVGVGPNGLGAGNGRLDEEPAPEGSTRYTNYTPADYSQYRRLECYIFNRTPQDGGGGNAAAPSDNDIFFIRFGADEDNYYEYATQMSGKQAWERVTVSLERFLSLQAKGQPFVEAGDDIAHQHYRIVGDPSLLNIVEVRVGVRTKAPREGGAGGFLDYREVWVNNITLTDPEAQVGTAKRARCSLDFGNFVQLGGGIRNVGAGFEEIGTVSGARSTTTSKDGDVTVQLAKFMPDLWNVRMPLSGSLDKSETITEEKYDPRRSIYTRGRTISVSRKISLSFDKYKLPSWDVGFQNSDSVNYKYARTTESDTYSGGVDYDIFPPRRYLPANIRSDFDRQFRKTRYGDKEDEPNATDWVTDDSRSSVKFEPVKDLELTPSYDYDYTRDRVDRTEESFDETYGMKVNYFGVKGLRPTTSYSSSYREMVEISGGGESGTPPSDGGAPQGLGRGGVILGGGETLDISLSADYNLSVPIDMGKLSDERARGINQWTITPSYDLLRSSSYENMTARAPLKYRIGRIHHLPDIPSSNFVSSRRRYSVTVNNRFRPFEFLGYREGTKWENWDFIRADFDYSYSNELSNTTGTPSRTISTTFPDVTVQLYGTKNFPLVADYLDRSTVELSYYRRRTYTQVTDVETKQRPGVSWRATWTRTFRTRADYYYTRTKTEELDENDEFAGVPAHVVVIKNPSLTLYYDLAMPRGFEVPLLGTIRWRNELNLSAGASFTQTRGDNAVGQDDTDEWEYTLSGGYYITTNLHADVTGSVNTFKNLTEVGSDYVTVGVNGNFEIIF